jgi:hypothetical protein
MFIGARQWASQIKSRCRQEMVSVLLWLIYLCGVLVVAAGASVAADLFSGRGVPFSARTGVIVCAGVSWPVLLVGLLQLVFIAGLAAAVRTALAAQHVNRPAMGKASVAAN